jgi:hypothetical protein
VRGDAAQLESTRGQLQKSAQIAGGVSAGESLQPDLKNRRAGTNGVGFHRLCWGFNSGMPLHLWIVVARAARAVLV